MKNVLLVITVLFLSLTAFSSCKKRYRCVCEDGKVVNAYVDRLSKEEAEVEKTKCESATTCIFERDK